MSDDLLRRLEREARANPDDGPLWERWRTALARSWDVQAEAARLVERIRRSAARVERLTSLRRVQDAQVRWRRITELQDRERARAAVLGARLERLPGHEDRSGRRRLREAERSTRAAHEVRRRAIDLLAGLGGPGEEVECPCGGRASLEVLPRAEPTADVRCRLPGRTRARTGRVRLSRDLPRESVLARLRWVVGAEGHRAFDVDLARLPRWPEPDVP